MDLKQKYTEDDFELDEWFLKQIREFKGDLPGIIGDKIDGMPKVETTDGEIEFIAGNVNDKDNNPVFFLLEYFKEDKGSPVVLIDIHKIELDNYLDFIKLNQFIK
tara:strand:- start:1215 stop:1529 length:315 start_codon:yes stop_codon:yes gene_type:complete